LETSDYDEVRTRLGQAGVAEIREMIPESRPYLTGFFFDDGDQVWVIRAGGSGPEG
jgi:hypothetical protein